MNGEITIDPKYAMNTPVEVMTDDAGILERSRRIDRAVENIAYQEANIAELELHDDPDGKWAKEIDECEGRISLEKKVVAAHQEFIRAYYSPDRQDYRIARGL